MTDQLQWDVRIPAYPDGMKDPVYDTGCDATHDDVGGTTEVNSAMQLIRQTSPEAFRAWCGQMAAAGYPCSFERNTESLMIRGFEGNGKRIWAWYTLCEHTVRIVDDRSSNVSLADFNEGCEQNTLPDVQFSQFGLFYTPEAYERPRHWITCDCGMMYMLRLRNNKLILVDGGEAEQATECSVREFMTRIRAMTQTREDEPITVACWICTHPHDDHMDFFIKLVKKYRKVLRVERTLFNFPAFRNQHMDFYVGHMHTVFRDLLPEMHYIKAHTGMQLHLAGADIEVLFTHEDLVDGAADGCYPGSVNGTSMIFNLSFEGRSVLFLGDTTPEAEAVFCPRIGPEGLNCTWVQAAHHAHNKVYRLYEKIHADRLLLPCCRYMVNKNRPEIYAVLRGYFADDKILFAGDHTLVYRISGSTETEETYPVVGCEYDGT